MITIQCIQSQTTLWVYIYEYLRLCWHDFSNPVWFYVRRPWYNRWKHLHSIWKYHKMSIIIPTASNDLAWVLQWHLFKMQHASYQAIFDPNWVRQQHIGVFLCRGVEYEAFLNFRNQSKQLINPVTGLWQSLPSVLSHQCWPPCRCPTHLSLQSCQPQSVPPPHHDFVLPQDCF